MRAIITATIAILVLASAHGAFAQTDPRSQSEEATSTNIREQHPEWFEKKGIYRPCPASVTFQNGRNACLGCPRECGWHF